MKATRKIFVYYHTILGDLFLVILCITNVCNLYGQIQENEFLQSKTYDQLRRIFNDVPSDSISRRELIATAYLNKSKDASDTVNIARGYYLFSILYNQPVISTKYSDSIIEITKDINHSSFPASGYFLKGYWCYELSE